MTTPIPQAAINAEAPTSRSTFRLLAGCLGATNRDADTLRRALLAQWEEYGGVEELAFDLGMFDAADPEGVEGVESRLAIWFSNADPADGQLVGDNDPVLTGLSDEFRTRLTDIAGPAED